MKATLIKEKEGVYSLLDGNRFISTTECKEGTLNKLSIKNCEAIANGYDLDELAKDYAINQLANPNEYEHSIYASTIQNTYMVGFQKALEILGDKKFSEDNMIEFAMSMISQYQFGNTNIHSRELLKESLPQQTEFDVKIVTELAYTVIENSETEMMPEPHIKLDADSCLILKRI